MAGPSRYAPGNVAPEGGEMQHAPAQVVMPLNNPERRFVLVNDFINPVPLQVIYPSLDDFSNDHGFMGVPTTPPPGAHSSPAIPARPQPLSTPAMSHTEAGTDVGTGKNLRRSQRRRGTRHADNEPFYAVRGRSGAQATSGTLPNDAANRYGDHIHGERQPGQTAGGVTVPTFAAFVGEHVEVQVQEPKCIIVINTPRSDVRLLRQIFEVILQHGLEMVSSNAEVLDNGVTVISLVCKARQNATLQLNNNLHAALQAVVSDCVIDQQQ